MRRLRLLSLLLAFTSLGCDIALTMPSPVVQAPTAPGNVTVTNTTTVTVDRSDTEATPTPSSPPASSSGALPLPGYGEGVARDYAAAHPAQVTHSCQLTDGEAAWAFLDGLIGVLQARDARWGYLCKDANCLTQARDVVAYRASAGDTGIWIVDVLGNHCPGPADSPTMFRWGVLPFETARRWIGHR
jgi:hypothetical protein